MSKNIIQEYENSQKELSIKLATIQKLQQQKTELELQNRNMQEILQINSQIQTQQEEINILKARQGKLQLEYNQALEANKALTNQLDNLNHETKEIAKLTNIYDDFFASIDSILDNYSEFNGQKIDTTQMVVRLLPQSELHNSTALKEACKQQSQNAFDDLLKKMSNINTIDSQGMNLLMYSLKHGFWYGVEKLLNLGADVNVIDKNGCNALIYACTMPHFKYVNRIIEATKDVNLKLPGTGDNALHCLLKQVGVGKIWFDEVDFIQESDTRVKNHVFLSGTLIINNPGAESITINQAIDGGTDNDGFTIDQQKALIICKVLKEKGADFSCKNNQGLTPYLYACENQQKFLINKLTSDQILDIEKLDQTGFQSAAGFLLLNDKAALKGWVQNHPSSLQCHDENGNTLLHYATQRKNLDLVQLLTHLGANQDAQNSQGFTPLFLACALKEASIAHFLLNTNFDINLLCKGGNGILSWVAELRDTALIEQVLNKGVNINHQDATGKTLLFWMVEYGWADMAKWLLEHKADANLPDSAGDYPLHIAVSKDLTEIVEALVPYADPNLANLKEEYPLGISVSKKNWACFKALLNSAKIDINCQSTALKVTPLFIATQDESEEMVDILISKGANLNLSRQDVEISPLHISVIKNNINLCLKLLNNGADQNLQDTQGMTPLYLACILKHKAIAEFLLKQQPDIKLISNDGNGILSWVAELRDTALIEQVLNKGVNINHQDASGKTLLFWMVQYDWADMAKWLLEHKADANIKNGQDQTAFYSACIVGNMKMIHLLKEHGADINILHKGYHPIHAAVHNGHIEIIGELIKFGVNIDTRATSGETPLQYYCQLPNSDSKVIKFLLSKSADQNLQDAQGMTPLYLACKLKNKAVAEFLLQQQPDITLFSNDGNGILSWVAELRNTALIEQVLNKGVNINHQDSSGKTLLSWMVQYGWTDMVQCLLEHKADAQVPSNSGTYPWHVAASLGFKDILQLLEPSSTIDLKTNSPEQYTALWYAAQNGHNETVTYLLQKGADVNYARQSDGRTALQAAVINKNFSTIELLIKYSADLNQTDNNGFSALYLAAETCDLNIVRFLIEHNAKVNSVTNSGDQPIHMACFKSHIGIIKILLEHGAQLDAVSNIGNTPLHEVLWEQTTASNDQKIKALQYLIAQSADLNAINNQGTKVIDLAINNLPEAIPFIEHPETILPLAELESGLIGESLF